ncbi:K02A2.6-like [Cordylochernes scorpioides]|uniref:K02A2.6-like n=1 Tax=Cordylochernes scorpioides TaxID=51811 RepID=A0ABY6KUQ8_9ARAC|nr:K02A2.6-like [Cordylochernes scorpioides]
MLENGIIEQSFSPFSSPVTLVTKRDKTKRIEDILDRLARAKYFSTADISSAYWQVPIHPDSRPLLAFATLEGLYQPTRLPFGLKTSPQIYERAMSQVLQRHGLDCVAHYFDDFIIFSNTLEEHQNHLRQFFAFCEVEKLQLNFAKCEFFKQSINFLGYTITAGTTTPLTRNTDIIHAIQQPHNCKTLQSFLGAVNVYNKFIPDYARLRTPLNNLLKKDVITISRRLVANGLHSCRPLRRLPLTPPNRRQRLEWCRGRSTWMTEWHRVVSSDESRFCLSSDSRRIRVWRRRGERSNPAAIVERPTVRQRGIMVWGAIGYDSRSPLLRIQGTMTAQRYVDDVLRPVTLPYLQGVPNAPYQQDNARPHTARISQQALQDVQMLPWPPYSPDLSPIEHVWDIIGRRLHALPQPRSEDELWQMVEREWRAIPQDAIRTLIDSLPRRVAGCIALRGGPTCY